jgi:hypothetical protein
VEVEVEVDVKSRFHTLSVSCTRELRRKSSDLLVFAENP